jgi:arylsulfatase A-like enzyme
MDFGKRPKNLPRAGEWQYVETDWNAFDVTDEQFGGDFLVTKWIEEQLVNKHAKPFFLACGIYRPHEPWFVPMKYFDMFPLADIQLPSGYKKDDLDDVPPEGQRLARNRYFAHIQEQGQWKQGVQAYLASIAYADAMVGRALDALEKSPYRDNTIVVLWSDHGWHLGEKEHWQKYTGWRVCTRVPLIILVPKGASGLPAGTIAGGVCERPVSLLSLYPTLTELCGLPAKPDNDGPSLVPLLKNPQAAWSNVAITQLDRPGNYSVSAGDWRYIHYRDDGEELYRISSDRYEWTNLARLPETADRLAEMRRLGPVLSPQAKAAYEALTAKQAASRVAFLDWHKLAGTEPPASKPSGKSFLVTFFNKRPQPVKLFWVSPENKRKLYTEILPEAGQPQSTRKGAIWLITDARDTALGYFVVGESEARAVIAEE